MRRPALGERGEQDLTDIPHTWGPGQPLLVHTGLSTIEMPGSSEQPNTLPDAHLAPSDHL